MKRYENMSKEEIIQLYTDFDCGDCNHCPLYDSEKAKHKCGEENGMSCSEEIKSWLNQEIEMIPRAWTFNTAEEADEAWGKFMKENGCDMHDISICEACDFGEKEYGCYMEWLYKRVEK